MNSRIIKRVVCLAILCMLVVAFAIPAASAASYSKVYGQTQDRIRVRESASTNAAVIDNLVKKAAVYVTASKVSGGSTFVQIKYRAADGSVETGWVCQNDGKNTYVKILSAKQAKDTFSVEGGNLPSKAAGTFTAKQRKAAVSSSDSTYLKPGSNGETVKSVQTKLKALKFYSGEITGNVGKKTEEAIKAFQSRYGLTADGIAGPQTIAKIDAVYAEKAGTSSTGSTVVSGSGLKVGSNGTAVRNLQQNLTSLGFYWAEITGNFGAKTETAVKRFQEENGLPVDGIAGTKTLNAIAAAVERKGGTSAGSASSGTTLKLNSQGTKVSDLQKNLKQLGYYYAEITGNFGEKTEAAVKKFQAAKGLTADGIAGGKTLSAIASAISAAGGATDDKNSASGLKLGSTGSAVSNLQRDLTTLGIYYGDITGHYGAMTQTAVKTFQKRYGLAQDGVAGSSTINAIAKAIVNKGGTPSSGTSSSGTSASLRQGDSGPAVKELQEMLKSLKYYYGDVTGNFGDLTRKAVRKFQDDNNLTVDGIAGTSTINKLRALTGSTGSSTGSAGGSSVSTEKSYGRIEKDNVYLRSSASTSSASKATLSKGKLVRITKTVTVSGVKWYYITVKMGSYTYNGYVRSDMLTEISESEYESGGGNKDNIVDSETLGMIRVTKDKVNLRYDPSTDAKIVGTANTGDVFYYVNTVAGWFQTKAGYWISSDYAKRMTDSEVDSYLNTNGGSVSDTYRYNDTGAGVTLIQEMLTALDYYDRSVTGHYGKYTEEAVRDFQRDHGLSADGVVGPKTMAAITEAYANKGGTSVTIGDKVYNMDWFEAKNKGKFKDIGLVRGEKAKLTDLKTGKSLNIYIQSTGAHADVEPLTAGDTATLCAIYGVGSAQNISYLRRPMLITTSKRQQIVCSIYGQPHGTQDIKNNNFGGQFCLHFLNSTTSDTHADGKEPGGHQEQIATALNLVKAKNPGVELLTIP